MRRRRDCRVRSRLRLRRRWYSSSSCLTRGSLSRAPKVATSAARRRHGTVYTIARTYAAWAANGLAGMACLAGNGPAIRPKQTGAKLPLKTGRMHIVLLLGSWYDHMCKRLRIGMPVMRIATRRAGSSSLWPGRSCPTAVRWWWPAGQGNQHSPWCPVPGLFPASEMARSEERKLLSPSSPPAADQWPPAAGWLFSGCPS